MAKDEPIYLYDPIDEARETIRRLSDQQVELFRDSSATEIRHLRQSNAWLELIANLLVAGNVQHLQLADPGNSIVGVSQTPAADPGDGDGRDLAISRRNALRNRK